MDARLWPDLLGMAQEFNRNYPAVASLVSKSSGVGNLEIGQGNRRSIAACVISSGE
jgi:hypothetical protein